MAGQFEPLRRPSIFRKVAAAMWRNPVDPTIYGSTLVEMTAALRYLDEVRQATGRKITVTHLVARCVALALRRHPDVNAKIRWWGKIMLRKSVDIFLQVSTDGGRDLSGALIHDADQKSISDIAAEVADKAKLIRSGQDATYQKSRGMFGWLPWWLVRFILRVSSFLTNELHLNLSKLGMPRDPFGSAMVTSVGMFGVDTAFAPLTPIARCPMLILVTEVQDRPWVENGTLVVRPTMKLCATFDHRILDGFHAATLARTVKDLLGSPESIDPVPARADA